MPSPRASKRKILFSLSGILWKATFSLRQGSRCDDGASVIVCGVRSRWCVCGVGYMFPSKLLLLLFQICICLLQCIIVLFFDGGGGGVIYALLVWMSLAVLACDSLHVCTVCIWCCKHAGFCVDVFMRHICIFIHSQVQKEIRTHLLFRSILNFYR